MLITPFRPNYTKNEEMGYVFRFILMKRAILPSFEKKKISPNNPKGVNKFVVFQLGAK
jgi:hypothetical protein